MILLFRYCKICIRNTYFLFGRKMVVCFVVLHGAILSDFYFLSFWSCIKMRKMLSRKNILQIYKDAIELASRRKVKMNYKKTKVLYKLVLVTDPLDHSGMIYSPLIKLRNYTITNKIKLSLNNSYITKLTFRIFRALQALVAPWLRVWYLHDTNLDTLSIQSPRGQELLGNIMEATIGKK